MPWVQVSAVTLCTLTGCAGTSADLAMSYWKEYPSSCAFYGLGMLTPHKRMHQDKASSGKSDWGVSCFLNKSSVLVIQYGNAGRRYSRQKLEGKGELPLFLKVSLFNPELFLVTWFGCCSPLLSCFCTIQVRAGSMCSLVKGGMWLVGGDFFFFCSKKLKWVVIRKVNLQWLLLLFKLKLCSYRPQWLLKAGKGEGFFCYITANL